MTDTPLVYLVYRPPFFGPGWTFEHIASAWLGEEAAERERDRLNDAPYQPDAFQDYHVKTAPLCGQ